MLRNLCGKNDDLLVRLEDAASKMQFRSMLLTLAPRKCFKKSAHQRYCQLWQLHNLAMLKYWNLYCGNKLIIGNWLAYILCFFHHFVVNLVRKFAHAQQSSFNIDSNCLLVTFSNNVIDLTSGGLIMLFMESFRSHPDRVYMFMSLIPSYFCMGIMISILGPSLLDLQIQTHQKSLKEMAVLLTFRAFGAIVGILFGS